MEELSLFHDSQCIYSIIVTTVNKLGFLFFHIEMILSNWSDNMHKVFRIVGYESYPEFLEEIFIQADRIEFIADTEFKGVTYYLLITTGTEQNWLPQELIKKYIILEDTKEKYLKEKYGPENRWAYQYLHQASFVLGEYDAHLDSDSD